MLSGRIYVAHLLRREFAKSAAVCVMNGEDSEIFALAQEIENYLAQRPHATDTIEGVQRWWVGATGREWAPRVLERAMELLIERGVVQKRRLPDGRMIYAFSG